MEKIYPCLWLDNQAEEAARFYTSIFANGEIRETQYYLDDIHKPKGSVLTVEFSIANQRFLLLNGRDDFKITPAISFFVDCETKEELDTLWHALLDGGFALMPLQEYPFSDYFGWVQDQYGVSWQIQPNNWLKLVDTSNLARAEAVTNELYKMKKIDIAQLEAVYNHFA